MLIDDMISSGHARALLALQNKEDQYTAANEVFDEKTECKRDRKVDPGME